jgi:hypothetical protein
MARFLIEVPHAAEERECALAVKILLSTGSHYLSHADFGCLDGEHKAWVVVEVDTKEEARFVLPGVYRSQAKIVQLNKFSLQDMEELLAHHRGQPRGDARESAAVPG